MGGFGGGQEVGAGVEVVDEVARGCEQAEEAGGVGWGVVGAVGAVVVVSVREGLEGVEKSGQGEGGGRLEDSYPSMASPLASPLADSCRGVSSHTMGARMGLL